MAIWRPIRFSRINTHTKIYPFHHRGPESKIRKSRNTWNNREIWPWSTEWSRAEANRVPPREHTDYSKHKRRLYTWTSPDGQHQSQTEYILCSQRWRSSIQSAKTRPGVACGSDLELLLPNSDWNWRKYRKPFRYDLNQIPYDYTVEVRNRFKGLDLIDRVPDELLNEVRYIVQEAVIKTIPKKKKCKKAKWLSEDAL